MQSVTFLVNLSGIIPATNGRNAMIERIKPDSYGPPVEHADCRVMADSVHGESGLCIGMLMI
jgi:hypothetical protein